MAFVSTRPLDLRTAAPFGISRWTHSEFARFVVELRDGDLVGLGEGAPNARYGEERERDMDLLADLAPDIADLEGPAGVEVFCEGLAAAGVPALRAGLSAAAWDLAGKAGRRARLADARPRPARRCGPRTPSPSARLRRCWRRRAPPPRSARSRSSSGSTATSTWRAVSSSSCRRRRSATTPTRGGTASGRRRPSRSSKTSTPSSSSSRCPRRTSRAWPGSRSARTSRCSPTRRC